MIKNSKTTRILAIDPGMSELGYAVFEDKELMRYGVKNMSATRLPDEIIKKENRFIGELIGISRPHVVIIEKSTHPERKKIRVLRKIITHARSLARVHGAKVFEYDSGYAREVVFKGNKPTKKNVASFIAERYPELSEYVPVKKRILWKHKDYYWVNVFDACTLALAYMEQKKSRRAK